MSDLRYRIADAILGTGIVGVAAAGHMADAVIAALRLNYETRPGIVRASGRFVTGPTEIRYVTEWAAHD